MIFSHVYYTLPYGKLGRKTQGGIAVFQDVSHCRIRSRSTSSYVFVTVFLGFLFVSACVPNWSCEIPLLVRGDFIAWIFDGRLSTPPVFLHQHLWQPHILWANVLQSLFILRLGCKEILSFNRNVDVSISFALWFAPVESKVYARHVTRNYPQSFLFLNCMSGSSGLVRHHLLVLLIENVQFELKPFPCTKWYITEYQCVSACTLLMIHDISRRILFHCNSLITAGGWIGKLSIISGAGTVLFQQVMRFRAGLCDVV